MRFALEDMAGAEDMLLRDSSLPRHVCWLAQQAVEKAIKAALVFEGVAFPFRHDLDALRNLLPERYEIRQDFPDLADLTEWAVEARYPGDWPDATSDEAREAAARARLVVDCVGHDLDRFGLPHATGEEHGP